ncbi:MAG: ABC transporter substrate-binding protein [Chloroflexi bacterium]|nr:ABC transporter substrate-binding protein [Chloroflexota bacterium]
MRNIPGSEHAVRLNNFTLIFLLTALSAFSAGCNPPVSTGLPAEIPIGCVMPTASAPAWGPNLVNAANEAVNELNAHGGIDGKKFVLLVEDEGPTPATAVMAVHKLIDEKKVQVIIGGTTSEAVMAAGPYFADKNIPLVSPSATSTILSQQSWSHWIFRLSPDDALQGGVVAKLIKDNGYKKVAILVQDSIYGRGIEEMTKEFLKGRTEVVISVRYDPRKLSYRSELNAIKDKNPDCVLCVGYYDDTAEIYKQAGELGLDDIKWIATDGSYDMPLDQHLDAARFMEKAVTGTVHMPDKQSNAYKDFSNNYQTIYYAAPTVYCDTAYDGINLIARAIKQANTYQGGSIRDALASVGKDFHGASGTVTFDDQGSRIAGTYAVWKVEMQGTQYQFVMTGQSITFLKPK